MSNNNELNSFSKNFNLLSDEERKAVIEAIIPYMRPGAKLSAEDETLEIDITITENV